MSAMLANSFSWPTWAKSFFATRQRSLAASRSVAWVVLSRNTFLATLSVSGWWNDV